MSTNWLIILKNIAPTLAEAISNNLSTLAIQILQDAIYGKGNSQTEQELQQAILQGLSLDAIERIKESEKNFKSFIQKMSEDMRVQRSMVNVNTDNVNRFRIFLLGCIILLTFGMLIFGSLWGAFLLITGGIEPKDPGVVSTVTGLVGTLIGYAAANAQQVIGFFFGSSSSSERNSSALTDIVRNLKN